MHRPWINWMGDNWTVKVNDDSAVDARVLVMIGSFKTAADNDRSSESSSSSSSSTKSK